MIIKSIILENYRRYKKESIDLPNGLIGIIGKNGAGKSTLIEAIAWCLYGNDAARTDKELIKRSNSQPNEDCKVTLELVIGEDNLRIERELKGKKGVPSARAYLNGSSKAEVVGTSQVSEYIAKRIGMDRNAFYTSVFAKQKELAALSDLQPAKRKEIIMKLLGVNRIELVIKQIRADRRETEIRLELNKPNPEELHKLEDNKVLLKDKKSSKLNEFQHMQAEVTASESILKREQDNFDTHERKYMIYNEVKIGLSKVESAKNSKQGEKERIEKDIQQARESENELMMLKPQLEEYQRIKEEMTNLDTLLIQFKDKQNLEKQIAGLKQSIDERNLALLQFNNELESFINTEKQIANNDQLTEKKVHEKELLSEQKGQLDSRLNNLMSLKNKLELEFNKIKSLGKEGRCPTCNREVGDSITEITTYYQQEIDKYEAQIGEIKTGIVNLDARLQDVKSKIDNLRAEAVALQKQNMHKVGLISKIENMQREVGDYNDKVSKLEGELRAFIDIAYDKDRHDKVKAKFDELGKIKDKSITLEAESKRIPNLSLTPSNLDNAISKLEEAAKNYRGQIESIGFDYDAYELSKKTLEEASKIYQQNRELLIRIDKDIEQANILLQQNEALILVEKRKVEEAKESQRKIELLSRLDNLMNEFKLDLISRIRPVISSKSSNLLHHMTNGRYTSIDLDDQYNIKIEDGGQAFEISRFSGGESDLINLCLRIAISQELSERGGTKIGFIALDEIFGSLDAERKGNVIRALTELSNQFRQVLLITHIEDLKETLPFVLNIYEDANGNLKIEPEGNLSRLVK